MTKPDQTLHVEALGFIGSLWGALCALHHPFSLRWHRWPHLVGIYLLGTAGPATMPSQGDWGWFGPAGGVDNHPTGGRSVFSTCPAATCCRGLLRRIFLIDPIFRPRGIRLDVVSVYSRFWHRCCDPDRAVVLDHTNVDGRRCHDIAGRYRWCWSVMSDQSP